MSQIVTSPSDKAALRFVLTTLMLNAIGFGIIVPVAPKLIMALGEASLAEAAAIGGMMAFVYAVAQFIFSPIMGNLADRFGRRPVLLISLAGFAIDFLIMAVAPSLFWVFVARVVAGVFGATNGPAQAVIADITPPEARSRRFGLLGAAFGSGFVLGPVIGGLLGDIDFRLPFVVAAAICGLNFLYGLFALPETLKPENRRAFDWKRANPFGALRQVRKMKGVLTLAFAYFLWQVAGLVYPMTWPYFTMGRYGWTSGMVGASLAMTGVFMVLTQIFILPRAVRAWGERKTALYGACGAAMAMLGYSVAVENWMAVMLLPLMAAQSLVHPNLTALMSQQADATTQGEVQGFSSSVMAVGSIVAPLVYNPLHSWFTGPHTPILFHGAAYVLAGLFGLATVAILMRAGKSSRS